MTDQNHEISAGSNEEHIGPDPSLLIVDDDGPFCVAWHGPWRRAAFMWKRLNRWQKV